MVYWAAGLTALFYLMALPVRAGAAWRSGHALRLGLTVGPLRFSARARVQYAAGEGLFASLTHERSQKVRTLNLMRGTDGSVPLSRLQPLFGALQYLLRQVKPHVLRINARLSFSSADQTALAYGLITQLLSIARALRRDLPLSASVCADFRSGRTEGGLLGILSCRLGHIMAAALIWAYNDLRWRIHTWITDNRSKAS